MLGLGAGIVPMSLARDGLRITVVEINPDALRAAREHFGFGAAGVRVHAGDARTYVRRCRGAFDVAIIDLFHGDNTPDYLLTAEFFADVRGCLRPDGAAIMNVFFGGGEEEAPRRLLATVAAAFPGVVEFRDPAETETAASNAFVVGTPGLAVRPVSVGRAVPTSVVGRLRRTLASGRPVPAESLAGRAPVTDEGNVFTVLNAATQMTMRRSAASQLPPHVLLN